MCVCNLARVNGRNINFLPHNIGLNFLALILFHSNQFNST